MGVVSLCGASISAPSLVTPEFRKFFRLGRALRVALPTGEGGVVHIFVVYGYQGSEEDAGKLAVSGQAVARLFFLRPRWYVWQPLLIAGDLNADPGIISCLAKGLRLVVH